MYVQVGAKPQADFDHPLELMSDCHRRVEHFLGVLRRIAQECHGRLLNESEHYALKKALDYFQLAAPRHHEDEELSLFPRLRALGDPAAVAALEKVAGLEAEHELAKPGLQCVDDIGRAWLEHGQLPEVISEEMLRHVEKLISLYTRHIRCEDTEVFPLAGRVLSTEDLAAIGREMAARRHLNPGRSESRCGQRRRALQL